MDNLEILGTLLQMTEEAEELALDIVKSERLRSLVVNIKRQAKDEHNRLRRDRLPIETPYQLCMIGILEESDFGRVTWQNVMGLDARLRRIHEEIDRTIGRSKPTV